MAEEINRKLALVGKKINVEEMLELDTHDIIRKQTKELEQGRKEAQKRFAAIGKRLDHMERALRLEERSLFATDYERQKQRDREAHQATLATKMEQARAKHDMHSVLVVSAKNAIADAESYLAQWKAEKTRAFEALQKQNEALMMDAKEKRRLAVLEERYQKLVRETSEKDAKKQLVETEEASEALSKKQRDEERLKKKLDEEQEAKRLDEIAQKQRQVELEVERKMAEKQQRFLEEEQKAALHRSPAQPEDMGTLMKSGKSMLKKKTTT
jgi:translation initiation factor 3 subunit A